MGATLGSLYTSSIVALGGQHIFSVISALTHRRMEEGTVSSNTSSYPHACMVLTTTCNLFNDLYIPTVLRFTVISAFYSLFTFFFFFFLRTITAFKIHSYLSFAELVHTNIYRKGKLMFGRNTH